MENFKQTKRFERFVRLSVLFLMIVFCVAVVSFVKLSKVRKQNAEYDELIASLKLENQRVNNSISDKTAYDYLESQARDKLGMVKENETNVEFK